MGIKQSERLTFEASVELTSLLEQDAVIAADFARSFNVLEGYPKITVEHRSGEAPKFLGFWVYGDGAGVTLTDRTEIEFELLHNAADGENAYMQTSLSMRVLDKRYTSDYAGYYVSHGKQLKNIRKRIDLLACRAILDLHRFVLESHGEATWDVAQMFSASQLTRLFKEMRLPRRFNGPLR